MLLLLSTSLAGELIELRISPSAGLVSSSHVQSGQMVEEERVPGYGFDLAVEALPVAYAGMLLRYRPLWVEDGVRRGYFAVEVPAGLTFGDEDTWFGIYATTGIYTTTVSARVPVPGGERLWWPAEGVALVYSGPALALDASLQLGWGLREAEANLALRVRLVDAMWLAVDSQSLVVPAGPAYEWQRALMVGTAWRF